MEHHDCHVKERPLAFSVLLSKVWLCKKMKKLAVVLVFVVGVGEHSQEVNAYEKRRERVAVQH